MIFGDVAFFEKCETCRRTRVFTARRQIDFPVGGLKARSKKRMCRKCLKATMTMLAKNTALKDNVVK